MIIPLAKYKKKHIHRLPFSQFLNEVYSAKIDGDFWINGKDGYFYLSDNDTLKKLPALDAYERIKSGYSWSGNIVCRRKYNYGREQGLFSATK